MEKTSTKVKRFYKSLLDLKDALQDDIEVTKLYDHPLFEEKDKPVRHIQYNINPFKYDHK